MANWSPDNAISAYLQAMKMRSTGKEPDVAEFISALAAGNNAQLMVVACATSPEESGNNNIFLALEAAAQQTGGAVVCILPNTTMTCSTGRQCVKFVTGDAKTLLMNEYREADCILIDCKLENYEAIVETVWRVLNIRRRSRKNSISNTTVVAFNAGRRRMGSWSCQELKNAHFLPIGEGLLVSKMDANLKNSSNNNNNNNNSISSFAVYGKKNRWLTKIDKYTGEEHVFRV